MNPLTLALLTSHNFRTTNVAVMHRIRSQRFTARHSIAGLCLFVLLGLMGCDSAPKSKARYYQRHNKVRVTIVQRLEEPEVDLSDLEEAHPVVGTVSGRRVVVRYPQGLKPLAETLARLVPAMADFVEREFSVRWQWSAELRLVRVDRQPAKFVARKQHARGTFRMVIFVPPEESMESVYTANRMFPHSFVHEMTELALAFPGEGSSPVLLDYDSEDFREFHYTRWFRDGFASYVGERVAEEFCSRPAAERLHPRPFSALQRLKPLLFEWTDSAFSMSEDFITRDRDFYRASMALFYLVEEQFGRQRIRDWLRTFKTDALLNGQELCDRFKATFGESPQALARRWQPASVGIRGIAMSPSIAASRGIKFVPGVLVLAVASNSANLYAGDVIHSVNQAPTSNLDELERAINSAGVAKSCKLKVTRSRKQIELDVKLPPRQDGMGNEWL